jgi:TolA-binding protein
MNFSLLKLGMSLSRLNAKPEACGTFAEVAKKYPRASNSIKARLKAEQKLANCTN